MPSLLPKGIYDPESIKKQLEPVLRIVRPLLEEILMRGLSLFVRYTSLEGGGDDDLVILFLYRHLLELFDSVKIQLIECSPAAAGLQLRGIFESLLGLEYLTEDKSKTPERALAYRYQVERHRRRFYLSQDPETPQGKEMREFMADSKDSPDIKVRDLELLRRRVREINEVLASDEYKAVVQEYKKTQKKIQYPNWYSLHDGPVTIGKLAKHLKHADWYRQLYGELSERSHGGDAIDRILDHDESGKPQARPMRDLSEFSSTLDLSISATIEAMYAIVRHYRPNEIEEQKEWYRQNVSAQWGSIVPVNVNYSRA